VYTADLADGLGNLASRSLAMLAKYRDGLVPAGEETSLDQAGAEAVRSYEQAMECNDLRGAAEAAWRIVTAANQYIVQTAPWALAKAGREAELDTALAALARCLYRMAVLASPLMPGKAEELWGVLGQPGTAAGADWGALDAPPVTGSSTRKPDGLFPRPEPTITN
jgi:methionyl-tRNA synthetase